MVLFFQIPLRQNLLPLAAYLCFLNLPLDYLLMAKFSRLQNLKSGGKVESSHEIDLGFNTYTQSLPFSESKFSYFN